MMSAQATSSAQPEVLWDVVSDVAGWPNHLSTFSSVVLVSGPTPMGQGSRFEVRQPGLKTATYEVTEWDAGRGFTWVARSVGVVTTATHIVTGNELGSRLDVTLRWDGPLAGPLRLMLGRRGQRMIEIEATTLARVAAAGG